MAKHLIIDIKKDYPTKMKNIIYIYILCVYIFEGKVSDHIPGTNPDYFISPNSDIILFNNKHATRDVTVSQWFPLHVIDIKKSYSAPLKKNSQKFMNWNMIFFFQWTYTLLPWGKTWACLIKRITDMPVGIEERHTTALSLFFLNL